MTKTYDKTQFNGSIPAKINKHQNEEHNLQPAAGKELSGLENVQPLDRDTFPNQPRPGSSQLPATIPNVEHMLKQYGVKVRYNTVKKKVEILIPGHSATIDNMDNVNITAIFSFAKLNGIATEQVPAYVESIADRNAYNPVAEWITGKPWDGKDRLPEIYDTLTEQEDYPKHLKEILIRKWLLSAVAAALMPSGFKTRGVLTLQGPQGVGKTSWGISLVPDLQLREMVVKVDHHFDGTKDAIIGAVCHWIVEISELENSLKKDRARLKGFLTSDFDKVRRPYARTESEYQRRTVFFATVNRHDFLVDMTGNTRFWTIPVTKINYNHNIDMQQVFTQLAVDFHDGKEWWLNQPEENLLDYQNQDHNSVSVIRERLLETIDLFLKGDSNNPAMSASDVLRKLGYKNPTNPQCRECGGILREMIGSPKKIQGIYKWRIPFKHSNTPNMPTDHLINDGDY